MARHADDLCVIRSMHADTAAHAPGCLQMKTGSSKCLIMRKLIEKGVRFIQLYSGGGHIEDTWDGPNDCITNHTLHAGETDQPIAALIADLKRTGLWDETLLVWGGEFGRTPTSEGVGKPGRDHDWHGFSMWMAGAGVKGGQGHWRDG